MHTCKPRLKKRHCGASVPTGFGNLNNGFHSFKIVGEWSPSEVGLLWKQRLQHCTSHRFSARPRGIRAAAAAAVIKSSYWSGVVVVVSML